MILDLQGLSLSMNPVEFVSTEPFLDPTTSGEHVLPMPLAATDSGTLGFDSSWLIRVKLHRPKSQRGAAAAAAAAACCVLDMKGWIY